MHLSSSAASTWSLLGVVMLLPNSPALGYLPVSCRYPVPAGWLQGGRGGDLNSDTAGKSPPTASQPQPLGVCLYHMAPHNSEKQTW